MDSPSASSVRHIALLGFDGVAALDLVGVLEAFYIADGREPGARPTRYETLVIGLSAAPFTAESGVRLAPDTTLDEAPPLDTIVVPGGPGLRRPRTNALIAAWL